MIKKNVAESIINHLNNAVNELERVSIQLNQIDNEELRFSLAKQLAEITLKDIDDFMRRILYHHPELDPLNKKD